MEEIDAIRAQEMVGHPGQFSPNISIHPQKSLLEQFASCFGIKRTQSRTKIRIDIECPVKVTSNALEVPQRTPHAMECKVSNSCDELELGLV